MVFPSAPVFLDPPIWNQMQQQQQVMINQLPAPAAASAPASRPEVVGGSTAVRPNSMAERARQAKIVPQPEHALNCPRCDSTNTKFCYFNNYSLSQPRHFCKTCRRYWTRGGALRNVPVGGGCRRNKRSKSSKSSAASTSSSSSSTVMSVVPVPSPQQLPSFVNTTNALSADHHYNMAINFAGIQSAAASLDVAGAAAVGDYPMMNVGFEQWRLQQPMQQFPAANFMGGCLVDPAAAAAGLFHLDGGEGAAAGFVSQLAAPSSAMKMDDDGDNTQGIGLPRQYYPSLFKNEHYSWVGSGDGAGGDGRAGGASAGVSGGGWTTDISIFGASP